MSRLTLSISARLTWAFSAAAFLLVVAGALFLYLRIAQVQDYATARDLHHRLAQLAHVQVPENTGSIPSKQLIELTDGAAQAYDAGGRVIASTPSTQHLHLLTHQQVKEARRHAVNLEVETRDDIWTVRAGLPFTGSDFVVAVAKSRDAEQEAREALAGALAIGAIFVLLLASGGAYALSRRALAPVESMRRRAADLAADPKHGLLVVPRSDDELAGLARTLNQLLGELHRSVAHERRFVADAGHELRTPITLLLAEIELALEMPRTNDEYEETLLTLQNESHRLARLTEQLLTLGASVPNPAPVDCSVSDVVRLAVDRAHRALRDVGRQSEDASQAWKVVDDESLHAFADPEQIERAIANLIDNAFIHGAAPVVVEVVVVDDDTLAIRVADAGSGFDPEFAARATDRFSRADAARSTRGAGLGLSIVDAIARANGGHLSIRDNSAESGQYGACVEMILPRYPVHAKDVSTSAG